MLEAVVMICVFPLWLLQLVWTNHFRPDDSLSKAFSCFSIQYFNVGLANMIPH